MIHSNNTWIAVLGLLVLLNVSFVFGFDNIDTTLVRSIDQEIMQENVKILDLPDGSEMILDHDKGTVSVDGITVPVIDDGLVMAPEVPPPQ